MGIKIMKMMESLQHFWL